MSRAAGSLPRRIAFALTAAAAFQFVAAAAVADEFDEPLPAVAAQFIHEQTLHGDRVSSEQWRLWRDVGRIERELLGARSGEIWQRDGNSLFITQLFHGEQRGIEFQPGDMGLTGAASGWGRQGLIADPEVLRRLADVQELDIEGVAHRRYQGVLDDAQWVVTLRLDLMVPVEVKVQRGESQERIALLQAYPLAQAPWQPTPSIDYEKIDFSDLGDREHDPFLLRVQGQMGASGGHAH